MNDYLPTRIALPVNTERFVLAGDRVERGQVIARVDGDRDWRSPITGVVTMSIRDRIIIKPTTSVIELAEVWCTNDASNAVGTVNGVGYCATCITYAVAGQPR